jgi:enoyl-CoA hydratase/carnithine racemase
MGNFENMASGQRRGGSSTLEELATGRTPAGANRAQQACYVWREVPVPVIAAVHGVAFGGGFQLALGADIRIVAPDAQLAVLEIKWGLVPDMSGIVLMRGLVRDDVARELTWTGRIFSGEEAVGMGLATRASADPRTDALALAREIASKNPPAIRAGKRLLNLAQSDATIDTIFVEETREQVALIGSANQVEAVVANFEKRAPVFAD